MNVKFGAGERTWWTGSGPGVRYPCQISRLSGNVLPLQGEKPIFGPLSKNNTGMAALRADLPVMEKHHTFSSTAGVRPTIPTLVGMVIEKVRTIFASP